jgi:hypothetical protein
MPADEGSSKAIHSLVLSHHKSVDIHSGIGPFSLPSDLDAELLHPYLAWGLPTLTQALSAEHSYLFMDSKGRPFTSYTYSTYWKALLSRAGMQTPFPPQKLRHIFVGERRGPDRMEGPTDKGAAMLMGHQLAMWDKVYDVHFKDRETQQAVDAMGTWRIGLLSAPLEEQQRRLEDDGFVSCEEEGFDTGSEEEEEGTEQENDEGEEQQRGSDWEEEQLLSSGSSSVTEDDEDIDYAQRSSAGEEAEEESSESTSHDSDLSLDL